MSKLRGQKIILRISSLSRLNKKLIRNILLTALLRGHKIRKLLSAAT